MSDGHSESELQGKLLCELRYRINEAKEEYPDPNPNFKALVSELGELAESLIDHERYEDNTYDEALDVAATAMRIAENTFGKTPIKNKVWVVTSEYNEYNQHGEYLECLFFEKPSSRQLCEELDISMDMAKFILEDGGGRKSNEHKWYNLKICADLTLP